MTKLNKIEGVGEAYAQKLQNGGITSTEQLLEKGATQEGRREIAEKTGVSEALILRWVNQVDLARIKGVSEEYGELLEVAGVDSVPELAQRNPEHLYETLMKANQEKHLVRKLPSQQQINTWVEQAKGLPRVVSH